MRLASHFDSSIYEPSSPFNNFTFDFWWLIHLFHAFFRLSLVYRQSGLYNYRHRTVNYSATIKYLKYIPLITFKQLPIIVGEHFKLTRSTSSDVYFIWPLQCSSWVGPLACLFVHCGLLPLIRFRCSSDPSSRPNVRTIFWRSSPDPLTSALGRTSFHS